jgi:hypothetical protein
VPPSVVVHSWAGQPIQWPTWGEVKGRKPSSGMIGVAVSVTRTIVGQVAPPSCEVARR